MTFIVTHTSDTPFCAEFVVCGHLLDTYLATVHKERQGSETVAMWVEWGWFLGGDRQSVGREEGVCVSMFGLCVKNTICV